MNKSESNSEYFRRYRGLLGFTNQGDAKSFLGAKDIAAPVSEKYAASLVARIRQIAKKYSIVVNNVTIPEDMEMFCKQKIDFPYEQILNNKLLPRLNNQGRRPEDVLFSWLRGYMTAEFFATPLAQIFECDDFESIGQDDFSSYHTFKRAPTADYSACVNGKRVHFEIQSGFQSISDIKQHKVIEAKKIARESGSLSVCVHVDIFNGQCAFVRLDTIEDNDINWVSRQQMEGQTVFCIDQNDFKWRLSDSPPSLSDLEIDI
mgnify:FL=1